MPESRVDEEKSGQGCGMSGLLGSMHDDQFDFSAFVERSTVADIRRSAAQESRAQGEDVLGLLARLSSLYGSSDTGITSEPCSVRGGRDAPASQ